MNSLKKVPSGNHSRYSRRRNPVSGCPLTAALAAVGGKWKLIIVYWLAKSPKHFAALRQLMPGISQKVLTQGRKEEASAMLEQLLKRYPEDNGGLFTSVQAVLAASAGKELVAEKKIESAVKTGKGFGHFHHTAYHIACAYALMNKPEQAIKWLEVAAEDGFPCYPLFERDTNLNNLRQDARFITLMAKLRQQWEHYKTIL